MSCVVIMIQMSCVHHDGHMLLVHILKILKILYILSVMTQMLSQDVTRGGGGGVTVKHLVDVPVQSLRPCF